MLYCDCLYTGPGHPNSRPHICMASALPSPDPSPKPMAAALEPTISVSEVSEEDCELGQGDKVWMPGILAVRIGVHYADTRLGSPFLISFLPILLTLITLLIPETFFQAHWKRAPTSNSAAELCTPLPGSTLPTPSWHA